MSVTTSRSILSEGNAAALAALRTALGGDSSVSTRELDRMALAVDASHYLHAPDAVMRAKSPTDAGISAAWRFWMAACVYASNRG